MKKCVILRGVAGSGKSTYGKQFYPNAYVCSADFYHMYDVTQPDGSVKSEYKWDPGKAGMAHSNCMNDFIEAVSKGVELVVVDNTNIRRYEFQNYVKLARVFGYVVNIIEMTLRSPDDMRLCAGRNQHGVPEPVVQSMTDLFEPAEALDLPRDVQVKKVYIQRPAVV